MISIWHLGCQSSKLDGSHKIAKIGCNRRARVMTDPGLLGFGLTSISSISKYAPHVAINVGLLGEHLGASGRLFTNHLLASTSMKQQE